LLDRFSNKSSAFEENVKVAGGTLPMIRRVKGNLLHAKVEALVNAVNCAGVMGKGIAFEFKRRFPRTTPLIGTRANGAR
jgi:hypothetical protein